jgi:predicted GIY-YIG superfamily endonuclease
VRYVYLLQSDREAEHRYVGVAADLKRRLAEHNAGKSLHTSKFTPWRLVTRVAFAPARPRKLT